MATGGGTMPGPRWIQCAIEMTFTWINLQFFTMMSRFWVRWPHILERYCIYCIYVIRSRLNVKQNFDWLSRSSPSVPETANADGHQSPCVWTWSESKFCYHARTKGKNSKWCSSAQKWPQKPSQSIKFHNIQSTRSINNSPCAIVVIRPWKVVFLFLVLQVT